MNGNAVDEHFLIHMANYMVAKWFYMCNKYNNVLFKGSMQRNLARINRQDWLHLSRLICNLLVVVTIAFFYLSANLLELSLHWYDCIYTKRKKLWWTYTKYFLPSHPAFILSINNSKILMPFSTIKKYNIRIFRTVLFLSEISNNVSTVK